MHIRSVFHISDAIVNATPLLSRHRFASSLRLSLSLSRRSVTAFNHHPQTFVEPDNKKGRFQNFLRLFTKSSNERSRLSSADPNTVVNSCSDNPKRLKKPIEVSTEDDILHLPPADLPSFGNVLKPSESEAFLQFLTAPYIRIPLMLDFFANGDPR